jgi:hypothetical protein
MSGLRAKGKRPLEPHPPASGREEEQAMIEFAFLFGAQ